MAKLNNIAITTGGGDWARGSAESLTCVKTLLVRIVALLGRLQAQWNGFEFFPTFIQPALNEHWANVRWRPHSNDFEMPQFCLEQRKSEDRWKFDQTETWLDFHSTSCQQITDMFPQICRKKSRAKLKRFKQAFRCINFTPPLNPSMDPQVQPPNLRFEPHDKRCNILTTHVTTL